MVFWFETAAGGVCAFHARNPYYIDTGITIKDGDEFNLRWHGEYVMSDFFNNKSKKNATRKRRAKWDMRNQIPADFMEIHALCCGMHCVIMEILIITVTMKI